MRLKENEGVQTPLPRGNQRFSLKSLHKMHGEELGSVIDWMAGSLTARNALAIDQGSHSVPESSQRMPAKSPPAQQLIVEDRDPIEMYAGHRPAVELGALPRIGQVNGKARTFTIYDCLVQEHARKPDNAL